MKNYKHLLVSLVMAILLIGAFFASPPGNTRDDAGTAVKESPATVGTETPTATYNLSAIARALESIGSREVADIVSGAGKERAAANKYRAPKIRANFRSPRKWQRHNSYNVPPGESSLHLILTTNLAASRGRPEIVRMI